MTGIMFTRHTKDEKSVILLIGCVNDFIHVFLFTKEW